MFNDDDFFIDDEELAEDNQPNIIDEAIIKSLQTMQKITTELIDNIRFNEVNDQAANLRLLSIHLDSITKLASIDDLGLSDEEIYEEIEKVIKQTTILDMKNIDTILKPLDEEISENEENQDNNSSNNGDTDW